ncbi:MAG: 4'-phosphopantetheinyl transferase family protein, partial [Paracoccaceae bacterium]
AALPGAGIGWADPRATAPGDLPIGAIPARRAEFAAGRAAAAQALAALGITADVPMGDDRAPIWPAGISGSITHTKTMAFAAVATAGAIGIDLEPEGAVAADLWTHVLRPEEREIVRQNPALATRIFCAKEAVFKAQYPLTKLMFGFERLLITLDGGGFAARFMADTGAIGAGHVWPGQLICADGHILAVCHA